MNADQPYGQHRLRRGIAHFLAGRAATGILGVIILMLQVRLLSQTDYGSYVTLFAMFEVFLTLSVFGLDWVGLRFIPEYRLHGGPDLRPFVTRLVLLRLASLLAGALAWYLTADIVASFLGLEGQQAAVRLFGAILITEGCFRFLVAVAFDSLLAQAQSQVAMLMRNVAYAGLLFLAMATHTAPLPLDQLVLWELAASVIGLASAQALLWLLLRQSEVCTNKPDWSPPPFGSMARLGGHMYASNLLSLLYGGQALVLLAARLLGTEATAVYGFCRNIGEVVRKFLPAQLLGSLLRPAILARFSQTGNFMQLNAHLSLVYLLSMLVLVPGLLVVALAGDPLVAMLSSGKYPDSGWLLLGVLMVFIPFSHRIVLELAVTAVQRADLWTRAALVSACLALPAAAGLVHWLGMGAAAFVVSALLAEVAANFVVVRGLRVAGWAYSIDWHRPIRLAGSAAAAVALLLPFAAPHDPPWLTLGQVTAALIVMGAIAWRAKVLSSEDWQRLIRYLPSRR